MDKFNESKRQWEAEFSESQRQYDSDYKLSESSVTGSYNGQSTLQSQQNTQKNLAEAGWTLLQSGIMPSSSQLTAMGVSSSQAQDYLSALEQVQSSPSSSGTTQSDQTENDNAEDDRVKAEQKISEKLQTFDNVAQASAYLLDQKISGDRYEKYMDLFYEYQYLKGLQGDAPVDETGDLSQSGRVLLKDLRGMEGQLSNWDSDGNGSPDKIGQMIKEKLQTGEINLKDAEILFRHFGIDPELYIDYYS